ILQLLATVESSACLAPRDRLELGLLLRSGDDPSRGIDKLHAAAVGTLSLANSSCEAVGFGIRCLLALGELCRELECSERLGLVGGHQSVVRLMTREQVAVDTRRCEKENSDVNLPVAPGEGDRQQQRRQRHRQQLQQASNGRDHNPTDVDVVGVDPGTGAVGEEQEEEEGDEDEVQSAAALLASRIVSSGCSFPMRPSFPAGEGSSGLGRFPLQYDFIIANGARETPSKSEHAAQPATVGATASNSGCGGESISILVRPVKERQHSQFDVGFVMWPAAVILSRLLCRDPDLVRGRRVLEIGAGLGLAGLVAARIQRSHPLMPTFVSPPGRGGCFLDNERSLAAASVTLSDFNPVVLGALEANVALNADGCGGTSCGGTKAAAEGTGGGHGTVHVRHLDWDKLVNDSVGDVDKRARGLNLAGCGCDRKPLQSAEVPPEATSSGDGREAGEGDEGQEDDQSEARDYELDSGRPSGGCANEQQRETGSSGIEGIEHGERFDVIIASDHICQVRGCCGD
ncbi:unnamed protein product, partial [Hapterophycus canaliculatus]